MQPLKQRRCGPASTATAAARGSRRPMERRWAWARATAHRRDSPPVVTRGSYRKSSRSCAPGEPARWPPRSGMRASADGYAPRTRRRTSRTSGRNKARPCSGAIPPRRPGRRSRAGGTTVRAPVGASFKKTRARRHLTGARTPPATSWMSTQGTRRGCPQKAQKAHDVVGVHRRHGCRNSRANAKGTQSTKGTTSWVSTEAQRSHKASTKGTRPKECVSGEKLADARGNAGLQFGGCARKSRLPFSSQREPVTLPVCLSGGTRPPVRLTYQLRWA